MASKIVKKKKKKKKILDQYDDMMEMIPFYLIFPNVVGLFPHIYFLKLEIIYI